MPIGGRAPHPGYRLDPRKDHLVHGDVFTGEAVHSSDIMNTSLTPMAELINAKAEAAVYVSVKQRPLGRHAPGHQTLPASTLRPGHMFGAKTISASGGAKDVVFPPPGDSSDPDKERIYEKSHRSFAPGVQRRDRVEWDMTGIDPNSYKFGKACVSLESNVVGKVLNPSLDTDPAARAAAADVTRIIPKITADYRSASGYTLGKTRGAELTDKSRHPAVYGKRAGRTEAGEWGTADCMRGDFTREDQQPDADLGKAVTLGYRNAGFSDAGRRFGLPSIRTDVPERTLSIATTMDFGNGPTSEALLFPSPYADQGVEESDFLAPRPPASLRALFAAIGYPMSDAEFAALYDRVSGPARALPSPPLPQASHAPLPPTPRRHAPRAPSRPAAPPASRSCAPC